MVNPVYHLQSFAHGYNLLLGEDGLDGQEKRSCLE